MYWISYEIGANLFKKGDKDAGIAQFAFATDIPEARELIMKAAKEYLASNDVDKAISDR